MGLLSAVKKCLQPSHARSRCSARKRTRHTGSPRLRKPLPAGKNRQGARASVERAVCQNITRCTEDSLRQKTGNGACGPASPKFTVIARHGFCANGGMAWRPAAAEGQVNTIRSCWGEGKPLALQEKRRSRHSSPQAPLPSPARFCEGKRRDTRHPLTPKQADHVRLFFLILMKYRQVASTRSSLPADRGGRARRRAARHCCAPPHSRPGPARRD